MRYKSIKDVCKEYGIEEEYARTICDMYSIGTLKNDRLVLDLIDEKSLIAKHESAKSRSKLLQVNPAVDVNILRCVCGFDNEYRIEIINKNTTTWLLCEWCGKKYNTTSKMRVL
jgi:hypothetical protein